MADGGEPGVMFGPLTFPVATKENLESFQFDWNGDEMIQCILCEESFSIPQDLTLMFEHLFKEHHLVIVNKEDIASVKSYLTYWRVRFAGSPITKFCSTFTMDNKPDGTPSVKEHYYLLDDSLPEERALREGLQEKRLAYVLEVQERERSDLGFSRGCLFCRREVGPSRGDYLNHLSEKHNLQVGNPQNLVFVDQLIDTLERKMNSLECLFCEKLFKDRNVLKEHMRKKQHKWINPENSAYDKFYIVNYLEMGKNWHHIDSERDETEAVAATPADWDDWRSDQPEAPVVCLFCDQADQSYEGVLTHMADLHRYDYRAECRRLGLDFYQQVKLVNYLRRQLHCGACPNCDERFPKGPALLSHMVESRHLTTPGPERFNQPEFFFPTYENDSFLCHLEESPEEEMCGDIEACSITEELPFGSSARFDSTFLSSLRNQLMDEK